MWNSAKQKTLIMPYSKRAQARDLRNQENKIAEDARAYDTESWNRMNEYNSPAAQMGRIESAGLNPNLIYGTGNVTGNVSSSRAPAAKPEAVAKPTGIENVMPILNMFSTLMGTKKDIAQTDLIAKQTALAETNQALGEQQHLAGRFPAAMSMDAAKFYFPDSFSQGELDKSSSFHQAELKADLLKKLSESTAADKNVLMKEQEIRRLQMENDMNEKLKPYNATTNDPGLVRFYLGIQQYLPEWMRIDTTLNKVKNYE